MYYNRIKQPIHTTSRNMNTIRQNPLRVKLSDSLRTVQRYLLPNLQEELGEMGTKQKEFVQLCDLISLDQNEFHILTANTFGRPCSSRISLFKAFLMKAVMDLPTTKVLHQTLCSSPIWRRLCGWEGVKQVPSEATFSRACREFAESNLVDKVHQTLIIEHFKNKEQIIGNNSIDGTAISARESSKVPKKIKTENAPKKEPKKRGAKTLEEKRNTPPPEPKLLEIQGQRTLEENLQDLPKLCDWGSKRNSKGNKISWCGYKLHLSTTDAGVITSAVLTSASLHDSQVAIPLMQLNQQRCFCSFYDVMDAAYDCDEIKAVSKSLGHVPIIDINPRNSKNPPQMEPDRKLHYNVRSVVERSNSELKDNYGAKHVRVKGYRKIFSHLMFGVLAVSAKHLLLMLS